MENKETTKSNFKIVSIVLAVLLLGSLAYIYKMKTDTDKLEKQISTVLTEKEQMIKDLEEMSAKYDEELQVNTSLSEELAAEKEKTDALLAKLKATDAPIAKYKNEYLRLKREMESLVAENAKLKEEVLALQTNLDSTNMVLNETKVFTDTLLNQNDRLAKTVEKGQKLSIVNLKTVAVKERSSGKQIETEKARRADKLKISFTIAQNAIAKKGERKYYVQVIDSKNNVLGEKKSITFEEKTLTYSFVSSIKYANSTVEVMEELSGSDFEKGFYFVNIFDGNENIAQSTFELK